MNLTLHMTGNPSHPAIIFLHGAGVSSWMWTSQIEALSESHYCIAVDLPGSGESFREPWISFQETAGQIRDIIQDHAQLAQAHVVGLSLGGYVALHLLAHYPEVVDSMIVSGVTAAPFPNPRFYSWLTRIMSRTLKWGPVIWLNRKMMQIPDDVAEVYRRDSQRMSVKMLKRVYAEVFAYTFPASIGNLSPRLLAVAGEKEAKLIVEGLGEFAAAGPNSVIALAPNAHHGWNGEYPELFTDMVRAWVHGKPLPSDLNVLFGSSETVYG